MTDPVLNFTAVDLAIAKLELAPDDILVLKLDAIIDNETQRRFHDHFKSLRPDGGRVFVLDKTADISVVKAIDAPPPIPFAVYYDEAADKFFRVEDGRSLGMGMAFWTNWRGRRAEFPQQPGEWS